MPINDSEKELLRELVGELISENHAKDALKILQPITSVEKYVDIIIELKSTYKDHEYNVLRGNLSKEEQDIQRNKLIVRIIELRQQIFNAGIQIENNQALIKKLEELKIPEVEERVEEIKALLTKEKKVILGETQNEIKNEVFEEESNQILDLTDCNVLSLDYEDAITELAKELAFNHAVISFGDRYENDDEKNSITSKVIEDIFDPNAFPESSQLERSRNILIVGAGATYDAFSMLPYGDHMLELIKKELDLVNFFKDNPQIAEEFEAPILEEPDFEKRLWPLSRVFTKDKVREIIQKSYHVKYCPNLCFEIIAHMLKNGFIDVVVNYNFDEILDQAIEEEVGEGNFHKIISDGDCIDIDNILVDGRIKVPIYIKTHGTASHKSSFDITKNYIRIPPDISKLLKQLMEGGMGTKSHHKVSKVNLVCVGFSMQCVELNEILKQITQRINDQHSTFPVRQFNIYHINTSLPLPQKGFGAIYQAPNRIIHIEPQPIDVEKATQNPLSLCFQDIWDKVSPLFKEPLQPRGIQRHQFIAELFYDYQEYGRVSTKLDLAFLEKKRNQLNTELTKSWRYHYDRVAAELALTIARNKGLVDPKQSTVERLGVYYKLYRKFFLEQNNNNDRPYSIHDFLSKIFNMKEQYSFSRNIFNLTPLSKDEFKQWKHDPKVLNTLLEQDSSQVHFEKAKVIFRKDISKLIICRLIYNLNKQKESRLGQLLFIPPRQASKDNARKVEKIKKIHSYVSAFNQRLIYDIQPQFNDNKLYIFDSFRKKSVLHTDLALTYEFVNIFRNPDAWDVLLIASERGRFMSEVAMKYVASDDIPKILGKKIINICCNETMHQSIINAGKKEKLEYYSLEKAYQKFIVMGDDPQKQFENLYISSVPYTQIMHHIAFFLPAKSSALIEDDKIDMNELYKKAKCLYYQKPSFSYKINPILLCRDIEKEEEERDNLDYYLKADFKMVLETYYALFRKAEVFSRTRNLELYCNPDEIRNGLDLFLINLYSQTSNWAT